MSDITSSKRKRRVQILKRLIVVFILAAILIPTAASVYLGLRVRELKQEAESLRVEAAQRCDPARLSNASLSSLLFCPIIFFIASMPLTKIRIPMISGRVSSCILLPARKQAAISSSDTGAIHRTLLFFRMIVNANLPPSVARRSSSVFIGQSPFPLSAARFPPDFQSSLPDAFRASG